MPGDGCEGCSGGSCRRASVGWTASAPERYVMELPLAPPVLLTCSPEDCRAIFTERDGALLFGEGLRRFAPHEAMFGHDAIAALDGEDHTRFRRQLTAAFHGEALKGYEEGIVAVTERRIGSGRWAGRCRSPSSPSDLARDVIATTVFGVTRAGPGAAAAGRRSIAWTTALNSLELAGRFAAAIVMRGWWAPYPRIHSIHAEIAAVAREEIAERRAAPPDPRRRTAWPASWPTTRRPCPTTRSSPPCTCSSWPAGRRRRPRSPGWPSVWLVIPRRWPAASRMCATAARATSSPRCRRRCGCARRCR